MSPSNSLELARLLEMPSREAMLHRNPSAQRFWKEHRDLLRSAWQEWEQSRKEPMFGSAASLLDDNLREAVAGAWKDPSTEMSVAKLWHEVAPDVFECQFFDPTRLAELRAYLEDIWNAEIPLRPPYGIVLNRGGAMLDPRSEGFLAAPAFQVLYRELIDTYMRPIARLLFPNLMGYDTQSFGFSIRYEPNKDTSIRPHTDASSVTLNINLNLPGEAFSGSAVHFLNSTTGDVTEVVFKPGVAIMHRGQIAHAAQPIRSGERTNFVLWLYGEHGRTPPPGVEHAVQKAEERWVVPSATLDEFAPF